MPTTKGMAAIPVRSGLYFIRSCMYRPMVMVRVKSTPPAMKIAANVATRLRSVNRLNGNTGFSAVRSTNRKAISSAAAAISDTIVYGESQPRSGPWVNPNTAAVQPSVASTEPATSSFIGSRSVSVSDRTAR
ncbi:Uncharacterised protein [Mycobacteroides abscessus subsp. abscessus]|nr:Uncharacterised protein [Mycobacteroides abscessus subsp. abscessus]